MFKFKNLKAKFHKGHAMFLAELVGMCTLLVGVAHYCWPAAVIAAGAVLVVAVERNS